MWRPALLAHAFAVLASGSLRLRLPRARRVRDVDDCFPFRGAFDGGCNLVKTMCESRKFPENPVSPTWCQAFVSETHETWTQCEAEVRSGDAVQAFVDTEQWTALFDLGGEYKTFVTACHAEEPDHCEATDAIALSRAPAEGNTSQLLVADAYVTTSTEHGRTDYAVQDGRLVLVADGTPDPSVWATLNGRGELVWNDGHTSRRVGGPPAGFGINFVTCVNQQQYPSCVSMCEGQTESGPCLKLCLALGGCRSSCTAGIGSRYELQSCTNKCLMRTAAPESIPPSPPCPADGCAVTPVMPPGGLTVQQAAILESNLADMATQQEEVKKALAEAEQQRDALRDQFRELLKAKIQAANTAPVPVVEPPPGNMTGNGTVPVNATTAQMPAAPPAPAPAPLGVDGLATTPTPYTSPAANEAFQALKAEIAEAQAQIVSVQEEMASYQAQMASLNKV